MTNCFIFEFHIDLTVTSKRCAMEDNKTRFTLRIDSKLFERLQEKANQNKRSANKEIEFLIEKYLKED